MNKQAAEKIASEYYNLGLQLALQGAGLTKTANPLGALGRLAPGAGVGALGLGALKHSNPDLVAKLLAPGKYIGGQAADGAEALMQLLKAGG